MNLRAALLTTVLFVTPVAANAEGFYVGGGIGTSVWNTYALNEQTTLHGFAGYQFNDWFAVEFDSTRYNIVTNSVDDLDSTSLSLTAKYTTKLGDDFYPFVGVGIGYVWLGDQVYFQPVDEDGILWNFQVGTDVTLSNNWDLRIAYRYSFSNDVQVVSKDFDLEDFNTSTVLISVKYRF